MPFVRFSDTVIVLSHSPFSFFLFFCPRTGVFICIAVLFLVYFSILQFLSDVLFLIFFTLSPSSLLLGSVVSPSLSCLPAWAPSAPALSHLCCALEVVAGSVGTILATYLDMIENWQNALRSAACSFFYPSLRSSLIKIQGYLQLAFICGEMKISGNQLLSIIMGKQMSWR